MTRPDLRLGWAARRMKRLTKMSPTYKVRAEKPQVSERLYSGGSVGGGPARNEIRSERLPAIGIEAKGGIMRHAQVGEIVPCE